MGKTKRGNKTISRFKERLGKLQLNLWRLLTIVVFIYTLILIGRSVVKIVRTQIDIHNLETERDGYLRSIAADSTVIEQLKHDEFLEQYARERYNMERKGETNYMFNSKK